VETLLKSKVLTEDAIIFQIIDTDSQNIDPEKVQQMLQSYIDPNYSSLKKKMLFMEQILDSLWNILDTLPSQKGLIFTCFIETIHPIITNKRDYGYVEDILKGYLKNKFENQNVFVSFSEAMMGMLHTFTENPKDEQMLIKTSKSFGLTLKFLNQSYENSIVDNPGFEITPFHSLVRAVSDFLLKNSNERVKGYLFKSLFDTETIDLCCKFIDEKNLSTLLNQE
jgi:hypothetical protein